MELVYIAGQLSQATRPEDVFGNLGDASDALFTLRRIYHAMAKITHPDMYLVPQEKALAQTAFGQLTQWFNQAEQKIKAGRYGRKETILLHTGRREYELDEEFQEDEIFNYYPCSFFESGKTHSTLLRIVRDPRHNTLAQNEIRILNLLLSSRDSGKFAPYLPHLLETFLYEDGLVSRQAAVLENIEGWYSLEDSVLRAGTGRPSWSGS